MPISSYHWGAGASYRPGCLNDCCIRPSPSQNSISHCQKPPHQQAAPSGCWGRGLSAGPPGFGRAMLEETGSFQTRERRLQGNLGMGTRREASAQTSQGARVQWPRYGGQCVQAAPKASQPGGSPTLSPVPLHSSSPSLQLSLKTVD